MDTLGPDALKLVSIIWVNIILSGDNAVVIALACRGLPADRRRLGMILGSGVAIVLRILFTAILVTLRETPFLKLVGGALLLWIAVKLVLGDDDEPDIAATNKLWTAVRTIALADAVMSLDNVLAIAAVAGDSTLLLTLGLAISIPLIVVGASLISAVLDRLPILVWAGAGLLGWIAGGMMIDDPFVAGRVDPTLLHRLTLPAEIAGAALVLLVGFVLNRRSRSVATPGTS